MYQDHLTFKKYNAYKIDGTTRNQNQSFILLKLLWFKLSNKILSSPAPIKNSVYGVSNKKKNYLKLNNFVWLELYPLLENFMDLLIMEKFISIKEKLEKKNQWILNKKTKIAELNLKKNNTPKMMKIRRSSKNRLNLKDRLSIGNTRRQRLKKW